MKRFRLGLSEAKGSFVGVDFHATGAEHNIFDPPDPVLSTLGSTLNYGSLFAYCFRRFGYPNMGWDDYKDLVRYLLTTPSADLVLQILPWVGDKNYFHIRFLTKGEVWAAAHLWQRADVDAWSDKAFDLVEKDGLPDWMPEYVEKAVKEGFLSESWRSLAWFFEDASRKEKDDKRVCEFGARIKAARAAVGPQPKWRGRGAVLAEWRDDDPLKPLAHAAIEALKDLKTPVRVRDQAINAYGLCGDSRLTLSEPAVAGYPSGYLGNKDPKGMAELHREVLRLGNGSVKKGIKKLLSLAKG